MEIQVDSGLVRNDSPPIETVPSLLSLDDMILFEVIQHLDIFDLTNVMETCTRLKYITTAHLRRHHSSVHWVNYQNRPGNTIRPNDSKRVFKLIGKFIRTIKLSLWSDFEFYEILVTLAMECPYIDTIILESVRMTRPLTLCDPLIILFFSKLKRFVLSGCFWVGWCPLDLFFGYNSTLEDLAVLNCCAYNGYGYRLQIAGFRGLKKLRLIRCRNVVTVKELQTCFENNAIRSLLLTDIGNVNIFSENVIDWLHDTLEEVTVDYFDAVNSDQLLRLKQLKVLRFRCNDYSNMDNLLQRLGSDNMIEELLITKLCISSATVQALNNFKKLTKLRLDHSMNLVPRQFFRALSTLFPQLQQFVYANSTIRDEDIIYMLKSMPSLTRVSFYGCNPLATRTYFEIIQFLENDWNRKLELIPPRWETKKSMEDVQNAKKSFWLRTDITCMQHRL